MKKTVCILLLLAALLGAAGCGKKDPASTLGEVVGLDGTTPPLGGITVLFTGEVNGACARQDGGPLGYAALAAYAKKLSSDGKTVVLVDGGDAFAADGALEKAEQTALMNAVGYAIAVPGKAELAQGVDAFLELAKSASFSYLSCNIWNTETDSAPLGAYKMEEYNNVRVAYVGIVTPHAAPAEAGSYTFFGDDGAAFYSRVQRAIDLARSDGADYVIGVSHLGTGLEDAPFTSVELIANISGMDVLLDANAQSVYEGSAIADKDGKDVLLCSVGSQMTNIGQLTLDFDAKTKEFSLIQDLTEEDGDILSQLEDFLK